MTTTLDSLPSAGTRPTAAAARATSSVALHQPDVTSVAGMRWQEIPVFIVNRNRYAALRRLVEWLRDCGTENICILDNASTYAPLLDWYGHVPAGVRVERFKENLGPYAFWKNDLHKALDMPYVFTDSDLVPADFCPTDLIAKLQETLCRFPDAQKVAPGLRIDNLSASYGQADMAFKWESQFWERPVAHGLFAAPVDTTFALYAPGADFSCDARNIRMGFPYVLEHTPWLVDEANLTEEERHYRAHTSHDFSHWSGANQLTDKLARTQRIQGFDDRARVLHLGCGDEYIAGWINIDSRGRQLDATFDFEQCGAQRLPLDDNAVDGIYMSHSLQRVLDVPSLMRELYRVARPDAKLFLRVPHGASSASFADPRSLRPWFEDSFEGLAAPASRRAGMDFDWQVEDRTLVVAPAMLALDQAEAESIVRHQRNVVQEMCVTLRAVKPGRDASAVATAPPPVRFTAPARVVPAFEAAPPGTAAATPANPIYKRVYDAVYEQSPIYAEQMDAATGRTEKDEIILGTVSHFAPKTLVDLGCGQGHYVRTTRKMGVDALGVEVSSTCCDKYLQDVPHLNMDAETFLRRGGRYDFLLCTDVLEHIEPKDIERLLTLGASAAPVALFGIANHSDIQLGVELHLIRQPASWWVDQLRHVYDKVDLLGELYDGRFFFIVCRQPKA